jgi:hypothetical protein
LLHFFVLPPLHAGLVIPIGGNVAESRSQTKGWDGIKKPRGPETAFNTVPSVSPNDEGYASLEHIFKSDWTMIANGSGRVLRFALTDGNVGAYELKAINGNPKGCLTGDPLVSH